MYHLLFIDDDPELLKMNRIYFEKHGFTVYTAESEPQVLQFIRSYPIDCVILDIMMPGSDGYELCNTLKSEISAPIIFLTGLTEKEFLYRGFCVGGDDFMTKPYDLKELEMRINARIRQYHGIMHRDEILSFPPLTIDVGGRCAAINGKPVALTSNEFDILLLLARFPGKVFPVDAIYREVWKLPDLETSHTVQVHVARMRRKLEAASPDHRFIGTVWGKGYLFTEKKESPN